MAKDIFKTQILILGLVDYLMDVLKNDNRDEIRNNLLAAIYATLTTNLLERTNASRTLRGALENLATNADLDVSLNNIQQSFEDKQISIDILPLLKASARTILRDFVTRANKHELNNVIAGVLM
jgi:hypothetical protein